jgi:hypothetical protein
MIEFQRGTMESELAFIISQIAKFIFKDAFLIIIFVFPLEKVIAAVRTFFLLTEQLNLPVTLFLALFLGGFLFMGICRHPPLQQKFKFIIRLFVPWLDILSLPIVAVSIQLLKLNLQQEVALVAFNVLSLLAISLIHVFYNLFHFTKEPRSNNLFKKREAQTVTFCSIATLAITYYLAAAFFPQQQLSNTQATVLSLFQLLVSLLKISMPSDTQNSGSTCSTT